MERFRKIMPAVGLWLSVVIAGWVMCACSGDKDLRIHELNRECTLTMSTVEKTGLDSLANELLRLAQEEGNRVMEGRAHFYLAHYEPGLPDSIRTLRTHHLDIATRIAEETENDTLLSYVYNQKGVWEFEDLQNVATSQYWFNRSLEHAKRLENRVYSIPAEVNLSETFRINNDTLGLKYSRRLFDYAMSHDEGLVRFSMGLTLGMYYSTIVSDTTELRPYVEAMLPLKDSFPGCLDLLYARYFFHKSDYKSAEKHILLSGFDHYPDMSLMYAKILHAMGKYAESDIYLAKAAGFGKANSLFDRGEILRLSASNAHFSGNNLRAYELQLQHAQFIDSIAKAHSADLSRRYRIEYEVLSKDREITNHKARFSRLVTWTVAVAAVVLGIALGVVLWIRRRNKMYRDIVRQNRDAINVQTLLTERITSRDRAIEELNQKMKELTEVLPEANHQPQPKISEEKADAIFERIQHLAEKEEVWRNPNFTRERFVELAGCNRTYFSDIIKLKTGLTYPQFMNSFRTREAIRILSDPTNETPLKELSESLGFLSIQSFYNAFKHATGISPDRYRRTAKNL